MVGYMASYTVCYLFHELIISKIMLNKRESENWASMQLKWQKLQNLQP